MIVGSASITTDVMLQTVTETSDMKITAELEFVPMGGSTRCLDFNVNNDSLIEDTEQFSGSLQPVRSEFDEAQPPNMITVYISDNDGKLAQTPKLIWAHYFDTMSTYPA